ncbi:MAG: ABC transporter substrate-binding protein [Acidimicrobiia bacterium]
MLLGLAVAATIQIGNNAEADGAEVAVTDRSTVTSAPDAPAVDVAASPFVYRIGVLSGITTDNFWTYYGEEPSVWNSYMLGPTKSALYSIDPVTGTFEPELAMEVASPTREAGGWRVTVDLNPDFRWSDDEPITARDVVFTFETVRALDLGGSWATAFPETVSSIHAEGEQTLRIEFTERPNLAVWPHGVGLAPVMAEHVWGSRVDDSSASELYDESGDLDVSGGRLALVYATPGLVSSHANPGYPFGSDPAAVEYHVYGSVSEMIDALSNGEVDTVLSPKGVDADLVRDLDLEVGVSVLSNPANSVSYLGFNLERPPMSDGAFRTALALLVDRDDLARVFPMVEPAWSFIPEANSRWFDPVEAAEIVERYRGDLEDRLDRALEGLRAAGYEWETEPSVDGDGSLVAGESLTIDGAAPQALTILTPGENHDRAGPSYARSIAEALGLLGFDARPVETDFDTVVNLAFTPGDDETLHFDMYILGWTLGSPALPQYYGRLFSAESEMNNTGYSSEAFQSALGHYETAFTVDEARDALWVLERTLSEDLPYLLLYTRRLSEVYRSDRVRFDVAQSLGGLQARLGGIGDVHAAD